MDNRPVVEQELMHGSNNESSTMNNGQGLMPMMMGYYHPNFAQFPPLLPQQEPNPHNETSSSSQPSSHFMVPPFLHHPMALGTSLLQPPAITGLATSGSTASSRGQLIRALNLKQPEEVASQHDQEAFAGFPMTSFEASSDIKAEELDEAGGFAPLPSLASEESQESFSPPQEEKTAGAKPNAAISAEEKQAKPRSKKKDEKWLGTLEELKNYKAEHGDCIVPRGYIENPRLASWVAEQRKQYKLMLDSKQSSITEKRVHLLNDLGFAWNAQEAAWTRHLRDLKAFRSETGHCHVPLSHEKYPKLGLWVKEQRRHRTLLVQGRPSHMTPDRVKILNFVGFCWDTHEATWLERYRELKEYKNTHGNCSVPTNFTANPKLGTWVHHQRRQYKKFKAGASSSITKERVEILSQVGFAWHPRDRDVQVSAVAAELMADDADSASKASPSSLGSRSRAAKDLSDAEQETLSDDDEEKPGSVKRQRQEV